MKKQIFFLISLFLFTLVRAETIKLKDGSFVSGSITSQTEYTLNINSAYGLIVLNQREVEAILPDKHRVHLKGGTELVGVILDIDEFNLKLQTDDGMVNIDMPQIVSIEVYDYEQGDAVQKNIAQRQAQQAAQEAERTRQAALAAAAATATGAAASQVIGTTENTSAGGLNFDADIEKVFDSKKPEIVNGQVQTVREISAADIRAQRAAQMSEEEAFLKGVSPKEREAAIAQTAEAARSGKLEQIKNAEAKKATRPKEAATNKLFSLAVGAQGNKLKLDNSERPGFENTSPYNVGGTSVRVEASFLWRLKSSNFWLGPSLALANIPKSSFDDLDPAITEANNTATTNGNPQPYPPGSDLSVSTSGQMIDIMLKTQYYFNPDNLFSVYAVAAGGYRFLTLNYRGVIKGDNINKGAALGLAGLGVQTRWDDVLIGLEVTEHFTPYSGDFKDSSAANTVASLTFNWKF